MTLLDEKIDRLEVTSGLVLIEFHAKWCASCRLIQPTINRLEKDLQGKLSVLRVDIDKEPELAEGLGVKSIPTVIVLKDGEVADRINGVTSLPVLMERIESI